MTDSPTYYHGTKADLKAGDLIEPGYASNYGERRAGEFIYLSATLDAAIWGAELAVGRGGQDLHGGADRIHRRRSEPDEQEISRKPYEVIPFPGTIRVIGEVREWKGHSPEQLKEMREHLEEPQGNVGVGAIEE